MREIKASGRSSDRTHLIGTALDRVALDVAASGQGVARGAAAAVLNGGHLEELGGAAIARFSNGSIGVCK